MKGKARRRNQQSGLIGNSTGDTRPIFSQELRKLREESKVKNVSGRHEKGRKEANAAGHEVRKAMEEQKKVIGKERIGWGRIGYRRRRQNIARKATNTGITAF